MTSSIIRPTQDQDIGPLQDVLDRTQLFPSEMLPDMLAPALAGTSNDNWLSCLSQGVVVGFCFAAAEPLTEGTWNMRAIAVRPDCQGQKLGAALVAALEDHLRSTGQRLVVVDTSGTDAFEATRAFYDANNYHQTACIPGFWGPGDDKVIFTKAL